VETVASILVVEDQLTVQKVLSWTLETKGYRVLTASDGVEALAVLKSQPVDLILADIAMPRMNGYQLHEQVVENPQWVVIPFLFLTARALDSDIRYGKALGVDDYLTKPIKPADLLASVRGKLRRAQKLAQSSAQPIDFAQGGPIPRLTLGSDVLALGQLRIDLGQYRVWMNGDQIKLSAREFELLRCLAQQANKVVSLQELVKVTHGLDTDHVEAGELLRPLIRSLRRKLGYPGGDLGCIENVRGVGYRLIPPGDPNHPVVHEGGSCPNGSAAGAHNCEGGP
jgi:two-component system alkaline phosphatase synthesis response regulator PhoP